MQERMTVRSEACTNEVSAGAGIRPMVLPARTYSASVWRRGLRLTARLRLGVAAWYFFGCGILVGITPEDLRDHLRVPPAVNPLISEVRAWSPVAVFRSMKEAQQFVQTNKQAAAYRSEYHVLRHDGRVGGLVHFRVKSVSDLDHEPWVSTEEVYGRHSGSAWIWRAQGGTGGHVLLLACDEPWDEARSRLGLRVFWNLERAATETLRLGLFEILPQSFELIGPDRWRASVEPDYGRRVEGWIRKAGDGQVEELEYEVPGFWAKRVLFRGTAGQSAKWPAQVTVLIQWKQGRGQASASWQPYWEMRIIKLEEPGNRPCQESLFDPRSYSQSDTRWFELDCDANWTWINGTNRVALGTSPSSEVSARSGGWLLAVFSVPTLIAAAVLIRQWRKPKS